MRLLCTAEIWASASYLRVLAETWLRQPPGFDWRLALSPRALKVFDGSPALANALDGPPEIAEKTKRALAEWRPDALLVSAGGTPGELDIVAAGRAAGIASLQYVDTWYGYRRRVERNGALVLADRILVADDRAVAEAAGEGIPEEILAAVGHPVWEKVERLPPAASRDLLFAGAPVLRDYGHTLDYTEIDAWRMLREVLDASPGLADKVFFAPHPDDEAPQRTEGAEVVRYGQDLLRDVDTVVGMFSAPLVDAFLAGRRAITLQPNASGFDMCPLSRHGHIPRVTTAASLKIALEAPAKDPSGLARALAGSSQRITETIRVAFPR